MKILYAVFGANEQIFHPSTKRITGTVTSDLYRGIEMKLTNQGVRIEYKGTSLLVPLHKFDFVELENEDSKELAAKPKKPLF